MKAHAAPAHSAKAVVNHSRSLSNKLAPRSQKGKTQNSQSSPALPQSCNWHTHTPSESGQCRNPYSGPYAFEEPAFAQAQGTARASCERTHLSSAKRPTRSVWSAGACSRFRPAPGAASQKRRQAGAFQTLRNLRGIRLFCDQAIPSRTPANSGRVSSRTRQPLVLVLPLTPPRFPTVFFEENEEDETPIERKDAPFSASSALGRSNLTGFAANHRL